jgi:hypothetical protein
VLCTSSTFAQGIGEAGAWATIYQPQADALAKRQADAIARRHAEKAAGFGADGKQEMAKIAAGHTLQIQKRKEAEIAAGFGAVGKRDMERRAAQRHVSQIREKAKEGESANQHDIAHSRLGKTAANLMGAEAHLVAKNVGRFDGAEAHEVAKDVKGVHETRE